jgi:hypothetical protein
MWRAIVSASFLLTTPLFLGAQTGGRDVFLVGGPLAGVPLPSLGNLEVELYPGAVECFRMGIGGMEFHYAMFDRQTQLKNWTAPNIPGCEGVAAETFPSQRSKIGKPREALGRVDVVRCKIKAPLIQLDLSELDHGLYVVRVIAAADLSKKRLPYEPLYLSLRVNDGLRGESNEYRACCACTDDFYSIAEFFFHAPERRHYRAELWVAEGSSVEPLVHNISLDDVLAGTDRRAIKTKRVLTTDAEFAALHNPKRVYDAEQAMRFTPAERLARDEQIWNWLPPVNAQGSTEFQTLFNPQAVPELGDWELHNNGAFPEFDPRFGFTLRRGDEHRETLLVNKKLKLAYTMSDLRAGKPLPGPQADRGNGTFRAHPQDYKKFYSFAPIARAVGRRYANAYGSAQGFGDAGAAKTWAITGNREFARDAAINLIRYAYQFPTLDFAYSLDNVTGSGIGRFTGRETRAMWADHYGNYGIPLELYDFLFDYIRGNEELAQSIGRFVPWVKTSQDVIELLDVYLVQYTAKRILRYHYYTRKTGIVTAALVLGDRRVTDPWMEWLFERVLPYGLPTMGIQDAVTNGYDRSGIHYVGSTPYAEMAAAEAMHVRQYAVAVNEPKFDLTDPKRFPKPLASCYWPLTMRLGGLDFPRIGDTAGPDKHPSLDFEKLVDGARWGWQINRDPAFAWVIQHAVGRKQESEDEWSQIAAAAATVKRAPWLENRSRTIDNWFAALEAGLEHDDYRFRRAAYLRVGQGSGHEHLDALDLQIISHGLPMTIDGGQRSGYSKPNDRPFARTHNTVEVDGRGYRGHSWASTLIDAPGASYVKVDAVPPPGAKSYSRQLALLDIDEGVGSRSLSPADQQVRKKLPTATTPGSSYLFDVFRVSGGTSHAYCQHAMVDDEFRWNVAGEKAVRRVAANEDVSTDENYLSIFEMSENFAGNAPETLDAVWRYSRNPQQTGTEPFMLGVNYEPSSPRKYLAMHLFAGPDARAYRGETVCYREGVPYKFTCTMTRRTGHEIESVFPAVFEPYAGEPAVVAQRLLSIAENETDSQRAIAVEVQLRGGRTDLCFADGRPDKERTIGNAKFSGEFAYVSRDAHGLRRATLAGGTKIFAPDIELTTAMRERRALVAAVDYSQQTLLVQGDWSDFRSPALEVGTPGHQTALAPVSSEVQNGLTAIVVRDAPDYVRVSAVAGTKPNTFRLRVNPILKRIDGYDRNWIVSNDDATRFWRADQTADREFQVTSGDFAVSDLGPTGMVRLWEYGTGDVARHSTHASVKRISADVFECSGDVDLTLALRAPGLTVSNDQQTWQPATTATAGGWSRIAIAASHMRRRPYFVKVQTTSSAR